MPTLNEMFPSQFLSGEDLGDKAFTLTIKRVTTEEIFDQKKNKRTKKWVLYFENARKGCLIGKTQAKQIMEATGTQASEEWIGKKIEVYPTTVTAFGEEHIVPRFRQASKINEAAPPAAMQQEVVVDDEEHGDAYVPDVDDPLGTMRK